MNKVVPEKLISFRAYNKGNDLLGITDIELPSIKYMTESIKGAGIAGEIDSPTMGHFASMEVTVNWRTIMKANSSISGTKSEHFDFRGAQQVYDAVNKKYKAVPVKCIIEGVCKEVKLGKFDVGASTGSSNTIEVSYIKLVVDDEVIFEIDKYNYIANIGGIDYLTDVRKALGL